MLDIINEKAKELPNPHMERHQCVEKCNGCNKMYSDENYGDVCIAYFSPIAMHRLGCALQSNKVQEEVSKKKINPLKASKRARRRGIR